MSEPHVHSACQAFSRCLRTCPKVCTLVGSPPAAQCGAVGPPLAVGRHRLTQGAPRAALASLLDSVELPDRLLPKAEQGNFAPLVRSGMHARSPLGQPGRLLLASRAGALPRAGPPQLAGRWRESQLHRRCGPSCTSSWPARLPTRFTSASSQPARCAPWTSQTHGCPCQLLPCTGALPCGRCVPPTPPAFLPRKAKSVSRKSRDTERWQARRNGCRAVW